jgi:hypothetical protein
MSSHKEYWAEQATHDYVFDRPSKTISIAGPSSPQPPTSHQASPEKDMQTVQIRTSSPIPTAEEKEKEENECAENLTPKSPVQTLPVPSNSSSLLVPNASGDSIRSSSPTPGIIITLDQVKRKAEEITERKNSTCSIRVDHEEQQEEEEEEEYEYEDDDDDREGTPIQTDVHMSDDGAQGAGTETDDGMSSCDSNREDVTVSTPPPPAPLPSSSSAAAPASTLNNKAASLCLEFDGQMPLWQAAERTLTPMFEIANSTVPSSASVSKSNSELSVRNYVDPKSQLLQMFAGGGGGHHKMHHQLHLPPTKSVDDSSDQSSWEAFSTTDESSTKGDFNLPLISSECYGGGYGRKSSSKESSVDLHYNCQAEMADAPLPLPTTHSKGN